ncbi:hypothetical protein OS493_021872 [Desmophyllum pertusum]|uniref:Uncharacterized protein n=1 Tax=Desmophyllum pertusum TaxID=174260 RepID=A0A9W9ZMM0_9CNID|nr:hypothetical protein OS493_021872 [Desmophyllum pertusum]
MKLAFYLLVQSCVFSAVVRSRFVQIDQSPHSDVITDLLDEDNLEDLHNTSSTESLQDEATGDDSNLNSVLPRLKRNSRPCEIRRVRKWNHCLEKQFTEVHCRKHSVACLSPNNIPPKCKKNYKFIFGKNGGCRVLTSCTCAA